MSDHLSVTCDVELYGGGIAPNTLGKQPVKYWEIIADRLHAEGCSYGIAEHLTKHGLLSCVDAHRDGKRFIVTADNLLTAFLSLKRDAIAPKGANGNVGSVSLDA
jgi:hypothetical protein